jgi:hypothetical protein
MVHLAIDSIGPFPEDEHGNKFILVIECLFSRYVELAATKSTDAKTAAKLLLQHFCRYGKPISITTDNGTQFNNELIAQLARYTDVEHLLITPYSHEENGMVERANKEVNKHLLNLVNEERVKDQWSEVLPLVQRIYNSSDCSSVGVSPVHLIYGTAIDLEGRLLNPVAPLSRTSDPKDPAISAGRYLDKLFAAQEAIIKKAKKIQEVTASRRAQKKVSRPAGSLEVGGYVLLTEPAGRGDKLEYLKTGPWIIHDIQKNLVILRNLVFNATRRAHITQLTPFLYDEDRTTPELEAMKDKQEFLVEKIMDIKNIRGKRKDIQVKVRWAGYSAQHDSWVQWKHIRQNSLLQQYCRDHRYRFLIRKKEAAPKSN